MPADVELARREGIELIHTGSWSALSGSWKPTRDDILAAVEAQQCPAVRRPRLKLGHTDTRFNSGGDGEPALGWIENLRAADDGHTLIGDQMALPWLSQVQAAAYPDRSIEGNYRHVCALGHTHPFVVTAVALLGVTPPAVSTLRSVQDLPAMLGVAASEEVPDGAEHVQVTVLAGRHSFDESKHRRDGDGQFTSGTGGGRSGGDSTTAPATSGLKHNEALAKRIPLAAGETYVGSGTLRSAGIAVAAVDGPDGRSVRLGVGIDPDEISRWSGANRGGTVVLDQQGMDQLREAIPQMLEAGKQGKARWRQMDRDIDRLEAAGDQDALDAHNEAMTEFGDFSVLDEGTISAGWGDLHLRVLMSDGEPRYYLEAKTSRAVPTVSNELIEASHLRRLAKLLEQAGAAAPVAASTPVQADGEHTSAVVMLIPTDEDAQRLAIDGGEPADELHVTLAYLGDAAALGAHGQQDVIDAVSTAANGLPEVSADVFSVAAFNPPGNTVDDGRDRTACLVWGLSGDLIDTVHSLISEALWAMSMPDQHRPWHCHMTAALSDDLSRLPELATRLGPVRFDRIRIAIAGQHTDIPLIPVTGDDQPAVAASARFATRLAELREQHAVQAAASASGVPASQLPAAEPEQPPSDPKEKDDMSDTDLSGFRSRLGLTDDATQDQILEALDALKAKADTPPAPTPEMVQASAAATEKAEKAEQAQQVMREELTKVRSELDTIKASAAQTVKASAFTGWLATGRLKPTDRETWEARYDRDPEMVTEILAGRGEGSEVPVMASGTVGAPEPAAGSTFDDAEYARLFGEKAGA